MNQELEQIESVQSNTPLRGKKRKIAGTAVPRIKSEENSPGCGMVVPVPLPLPYNNSGDFMMQSRFEPLNYMEVSFLSFVWRSCILCMALAISL
jgi:hypothetical protein